MLDAVVEMLYSNKSEDIKSVASGSLVNILLTGREDGLGYVISKFKEMYVE